MTIKRNAAAAIVALALATIPLSALAQDVPSYADPSTTTTVSGEENIHGRVVNFNGAYDLRVRDDRGYIDDVQLHQGTIINPTGITLEPGMVVSILGVNSGSYLAANEIDTPYTYYGDVPYWGGHPWDWYGPSYGLAFYFDDDGWWRGGFRRFGGGGFHDGFHGGFHDGGHFRGGVRGGEGFHGGGGHGGGGGFHGGGEGGFHGGGGHGGGGGGHH